MNRMIDTLVLPHPPDAPPPNPTQPQTMFRLALSAGRRTPLTHIKQTLPPLSSIPTSPPFSNSLKSKERQQHFSTSSSQISDYASRSQTPVSLRTLMETGRGDLLGRGGNSFEETPDKNLSTATGETLPFGKVNDGSSMHPVIT